MLFKIIQDKFDAIKQVLTYKMGEIQKITSKEEIFKAIPAVSRFLKEVFSNYSELPLLPVLPNLRLSPTVLFMKVASNMFKEVRLFKKTNDCAIRARIGPSRL